MISRAAKSVRLFESPVLEAFTHVPVWLPALVWGPVLFIVFASSVSTYAYSLAEWGGMIIGGLLFWSLTEYVLHRFAFHAKSRAQWVQRLIFLVHGVHHDFPEDKTRLLMPPVVSVPLALGFGALFELILGPRLAPPSFGVFVSGYLIYDYIHYSTHHVAFSTALGRRLKQHHMLHHFASPDARYGVSSPLWDYVFGSAPLRAPRLASQPQSDAVVARSMAGRPHVANIFWISALHVASIAAIPYFSWSAFWVCLFGLFILSPLGINLGYHRLVSHRALRTPKWLEYALVTVGAAIGGGPPLIWAAEHRLHHKYSDTSADPHDSGRGFWYSHVGHLFFHKEVEDSEALWRKYVPDLKDDRYYLFLNRYWIVLAVATVIPLYWAGGISYVLWGGFVRVTLMLHITWLINSATHKWGYRSYDSSDRSRNIWWVGWLAAGEGWHNNHHAQQACAFHGFHRWWEFDFTYLLILGFEKLGLATQVNRKVFARPVSSGASGSGDSI